MLLIGVTLSFGSVVAVDAVNQFNLSTNSASLAAAVQEVSAGKLVSLVYGSVSPSRSCPLYQGYNEGTTYTMALYDYGSANFSTVELFVNGTLYSGGGYGTISAGSIASYTLTLPWCAHPSGQTFLLLDANGDGVQVGT